MSEPQSRPPCLIILTRPASEAQAMAAVIERQGARVCTAPVIEFVSYIEDNLPRLAAIFEELHQRGGWLVLPSPTAIRHFVELLSRIEVTPELLKGLRVATIGKAGVEALEKLDIPVDFMPPQPRSAVLAQTLPLDAPAIPVIIVGSAQTRPELSEGLERRGARVQVLPLYAPRPNPPGLRELRQLLEEAPDMPPQIICVTSPSAVEAIAEEFKLTPTQLPAALAGKGWVAIGPTTAAHLLRAGIPADSIAEAAEPSAEGIVAAAEALALLLVAARGGAA